MRIILLRHGRPSMPAQVPMSAMDFKGWIKSYNLAELCQDVKLQHEIINLAKNSNAVLCSDLPRSISSAKLLGVNEIYLTEHEFREMEMPSGKSFGFTLKPKYWAIIFRSLWFFGYSKNSESFKEAKIRAEQAALTIESIAKEKQTVLFVGHGMLNRFIAKSLVRRGWKAKNRMGSGLWDFGIFDLKT